MLPKNYQGQYPGSMCLIYLAYVRYCCVKVGKSDTSLPYLECHPAPPGARLASHPHPGVLPHQDGPPGEHPTHHTRSHRGTTGSCPWVTYHNN